MSDFKSLIEHTFGSEKEQIDQEIIGCMRFAARCNDWINSGDKVDEVYGLRWQQVMRDMFDD